MKQERLDAALGLLERPPGQNFVARGDERDPRLGAHFRALTRHTGQVDLVVVGCPDEAGLLLNEGRPGARRGPDVIREALYGLTVGCRPRVTQLTMVDAGNVRPGQDQQQTHDRVAEVVRALVGVARVVVLLGGSHDLSFPGVQGYALATGGKVGTLLLDAHLDVRDLRFGLTNGSPFHALMEQGHLAGPDLVVVGAQPWANSPHYAEELQRQGGTVHWLDDMGEDGGPVVDAELIRLSARREHLAVSLDIDVAPQAAAPGTGSPGSTGLSPLGLVACARLAGACPSVGYFDVMEVSPPLDLDGRTALLAATIIFGFLAGLATRPEPKGPHELQGAS